MNTEQVCRHLRTKSLYTPPLSEDREHELDEAARACCFWCNRTMTPAGLDDRRVNDEACSDRGRSCYEPG